MASTDDAYAIIDTSVSTNPSGLDVVMQYLDHAKLMYIVKQEQSLVISSATVTNASYRIIIDLKEEASLLLVYVMLPCKVPQVKRLDMAEFLTRANYGTMIGSFEMDFSDGEMRYKGSVDYTGSVLVEEMVEQLVGKCILTMDRYFPGIMRVIYGDINPRSAIEEIEPSQSRGSTDVLAVALVEAMTGAVGETNGNGADSTEAVTPMVTVLGSGENSGGT